MVNLKLFQYADEMSASNCEKSMKSHFKSRPVSRYDMPDGYTETCHIDNLDLVIWLAELGGGVDIPFGND